MNLPGMKIRVKFTEPFKDGNIFGSKVFKLNEEAELTSDQYEQAKRSGAYIDILGQVLPPPDWGDNPPPEPEPVIVLPSLDELEKNPVKTLEPEPLQKNEPTRKTPKKVRKDGRKT